MTLAYLGCSLALHLNEYLEMSHLGAADERPSLGFHSDFNMFCLSRSQC